MSSQARQRSRRPTKQRSSNTGIGGTGPRSRRLSTTPTVKDTQTMKLTPQAQTVLRHLKSVGSITNVEANAVHRVRSLSRRITEIQGAGVRISKVRRRDCTGQQYVRYTLEK
ncbi:hypothetical protein CFB82_19925 [Burkholderia sp. HI2714]|nr:hypothetical protein CFB82_19925 [Burkholderia sp. HI2714]